MIPLSLSKAWMAQQGLEVGKENLDTTIHKIYKRS
jgi:hypothetical protein